MRAHVSSCLVFVCRISQGSLAGEKEPTGSCKQRGDLGKGLGVPERPGVENRTEGGGLGWCPQLSAERSAQSIPCPPRTRPATLARSQARCHHRPPHRATRRERSSSRKEGMGQMPLFLSFAAHVARVPKGHSHTLTESSLTPHVHPPERGMDPVREATAVPAPCLSPHERVSVLCATGHGTLSTRNGGQRRKADDPSNHVECVR